MKKKMLAVALMLTVVMTQICAFASSYATYTVHNEKAVLRSVDNLGEYAVIPKELEGVTIEGIGAEAFGNNKEVKSIAIPETVSYIEWGAFEGCENLTDINIPGNVMKIEDMTFADCIVLKQIKLPGKLQEIGVKAFSNTDLKEIVIPDGAKAIDIKAFENCRNLENVVLPESIEYIADGAFDGCENVNVQCVKGTYAEDYLKVNKISYVAH